MKVLSYLQVGNLFDEKEYLDYLSCDIYRTHKKQCQDEGVEASLARFMSQPFKPELITEYFEGWHKASKAHYYNRSLQIEINTKKIDEQGNKCYSIIRTDQVIYLYSYQFYPRTLDDFITDCQRAGIELEWRSK